VRNLPLRKAAGHDGIQNEHIIHAGPQLLVHLSLLFTAMLRDASVRNSICDLFLCPDCNNARFPPKVSCQPSFQPKADKEQAQVTHEETPQPQQISIDKTPVPT